MATAGGGACVRKRVVRDTHGGSSLHHRERVSCCLHVFYPLLYRLELASRKAGFPFKLQFLLYFQAERGLLDGYEADCRHSGFGGVSQDVPQERRVSGRTSTGVDTFRKNR